MRKEKLLYVLMIGTFICVMIFSLGACGAKKEESGAQEKETAEEEISEELSEEAPETDLSRYTAMIEEQVVYDKNDITVTATGLTYEDSESVTKIDLDLNVANHTQKDIEMFFGGIAVNGYMADAAIYNRDKDDFDITPVVPKGESENISLVWYSVNFEECGIEDIAVIEFNLSLRADENDLIKGELLTVSTNIADTYEQTYDDSGEVVYEGKDYRVIAQGVSGNEYGFSAKFYLENNSNEELDTYTSEEKVNGVALEGNYYLSSPFGDYSYVWPGHKGIQYMSFYKEDLEPGTKEIKTLDMNITFLNGKGEWLTEAVPVSIKYE